MKLLRGCEYVVHLRHVQVSSTSRFFLEFTVWHLLSLTYLLLFLSPQELKQHIVLIMELCDFDLDHLVKIKPFKEQDIIIFLFQLGKACSAHAQAILFVSKLVLLLSYIHGV